MGSDTISSIVPRRPAPVAQQNAPLSAIDVAPPYDGPARRRSLLAVLVRRWWIVATTVVVSAVGGVAYLTLATPQYTSSSRLLIEQAGPKLIATGDGFVAQSKNYLDTQGELLKSTPILSGALAIIAQRQLRTLDAEADPIAQMKDRLDVSAGKSDDIITIALESPYPREAAEIVNAVVESYIDYQASKQRNTTAEVLKILQKEKVRRDAELKERFEAAMAFKRDNEIVSFGSDNTNVIIQRFEALSDALTRSELALMDANSKHETARALLTDDSDPARIREVLGAGADSQTAESAKSEEERSRLAVRLAELKQMCSDDHPAVRTAELKLKELDRQEADRLRERARARLDWLSKDVEARRQRVEDLRSSLEEQRKCVQEMNSKAVQYAMLDAERKRAERICDLLDSRIKELDITDDTGAMNICLLEPARASAEPSSPRKAHAMSLCLVLGLLFGAAFAFGREWMDHRLGSADEVYETVGLPVLGVVPMISGKKGAARKTQVVKCDPMSQAAEAMRTVRTAVYFGSPGTVTKTIVVTSPGRGDGKSTILSNLGVAMADAGQKVLIVDGDLRLPTQHKIFELEDDCVPGVSDVLACTASLDDAVRPTDVKGLDLLPCGTIPHNPSEMLNSEAFDELVAKLSERYDKILIDAPPVLALADARILAAKADASVLVLNATNSKRKPSQRAVECLRSVGARILGAVVNGVSARGGGYGYGYHEYGYGDSYGYYGKQLESEPEAPAEKEEQARADVA
jgi:capsular exopolysaccharide synthesis family protein